MGFAHELVGRGEHVMPVARNVYGGLVGVIIVAVLALAGCSSLRGGPAATPSMALEPSSAPSLTVPVAVPTLLSPPPTASPVTGADRAAAACSAVLEDPLQAMLVVQSG